MQNSFAEYDDMLGSMAHGTHTLELVNTREYARYVHDRDGLYVFNDTHAVRELTDTMEEVERFGPMTQERVEMGLEATAIREINFLQSVTNEFAAPVNPGEGPRAKHPGNWADDTGQLNRSYTFEVNGKPRNVLNK